MYRKGENIMITIAEAAPGLDTNLLTQFLSLVKSVMGLFGEYPLNIYLLSGLCAIAFGVFAIARRASH